MEASTIKLIQQELNKRHGLSLVADGIAGAKTLAALNHFATIPSAWKKDRRLVGAIQHLCMLEGIDAGPIDGYMGPQTREGLNKLSVKLTTGALPGPWRNDDPGVNIPEDTTQKWPRQIQSELMKFYGDVGQNMSKAVSPYPLRIAWAKEKKITKFTCHEKVKDSIERVLKKVLDHYGLDEIQRLGLDLWGGCLNVRAMRGGTKYSTHSWGMAIDWDPERNRLRWKADKANFAKPEYDYWWKCWEDEGWVSLGREKNYDWMHVQAART